MGIVIGKPAPLETETLPHQSSVSSSGQESSLLENSSLYDLTVRLANESATCVTPRAAIYSTVTASVERDSSPSASSDCIDAAMRTILLVLCNLLNL